MNGSVTFESFNTENKIKILGEKIIEQNKLFDGV